VSNSFQYRGDLAKTALPEMLSTIQRFQVPGLIEARQAGLSKKVYIGAGHVLHATSSDLDDSLGSYLLRLGDITREQFEHTMRMREKGERRYGALLVELGILSPSAVYEAITKQVESIVWSLFYWQDGEVTFSIGDVAEPGTIQILLPMQKVILSGIKRAPNAKMLVARLGRKQTVFEASYNVETLIASGLTAEDYQVLRLVDGKRTLYEVCTEGPRSPAENAKLLYAFHVLRLIRTEEERAAAEPGGGQAPAAGPAKAASPAKGRIKIRMKTEGDRIS
jgi:hypothetical protein